MTIQIIDPRWLAKRTCKYFHESQNEQRKSFFRRYLWYANFLRHHVPDTLFYILVLPLLGDDVGRFIRQPQQHIQHRTTTKNRVFNNLNPTWATVIFLEGYKFGVNFYIEVGVFDFQAKQSGQTGRQLSQLSSAGNAIVTSCASSRNLLKNGKFPHKVMGTALFEVGAILGSRGNVGSKSLQTGGAVYAHLERCRDDGAKGKLRFQFRALNLSNAQSLGRISCPYFELFRRVDHPTGATWYASVIPTPFHQFSCH